MGEALQEHWRGLLKPLFPPSAYIKIRKNRGLIIGIDWRLKSQADQSEKFSRLIKIHISEELCRNFNAMGSSQRDQFDKQLIDYIEQRLTEFNPEHDAPRGGIPPQEEWIIDAKLFKD